jgi:intein/homing endonuclease
MVDDVPMWGIPITEVIEYVKGLKYVKISSYDIDSDTYVYKSVTDGKMTGQNRELLEIEDEASGYKITCTPCHLVYTKNRGYVEAGKLVETDELLLQ